MKNQTLGIVFVLSLIASVILTDKLINLELPFSLLISSWNPYVYWLIVALGFCVLSLIVIKIREKKEKDGFGELNHNWKDKVILIVSNTCSGNLLDIIVVISFFGFVAWIPDSISDFIKSESWPIRSLLYLTGLGMMIWGKPNVYTRGGSVPDDERRLLISGMSNVSNMNIAPLIKAFGKYKNIDTMTILLSNTIWKGYDRIDPMKESNTLLSKALKEYKSRIEELCLSENSILKRNEKNTAVVENALRDLLDVYIKENYPFYKGKDIEIDFSAPVDYNNFDECNDECFNRLNYIMQKNALKEKYTDNNIVVNTSPGTSVVTSVLTINAIKGDRAMIYTKQDHSGDLMEANPNVALIQFDGLLEDRKMGW